MGTGRRLVVLLLALTVIGVPAAALRVACVGASCRSTAAAASAPAPFCSLPADLRSLIGAGTYENRSPDAMAVSASTPVVSAVGDGVKVPWPSVASGQRAAMRAPLWFIGRGIRQGPLPQEVTLDRVAPTLEPLLSLRRAHPDVRSGTAIPGVVRDGASTPLVVLVVWKGVGDTDGGHALRQIMHEGQVLQAPPASGDGGKLFSVLREPSYLRGVGQAVGTATAGSLPLDPIAVETTIGTGGLPLQHGITGARVRDADGAVVRAFGAHAPEPVIATLGNDLDRATGGRAKIGLIGTTGDLGLTGDNWYHDGPIVDRVHEPDGTASGAIASFLADGWGADGVPDLLAVALSGGFGDDDHATSEISDQVLRAVPDATIVVAGTGSLETAHAVAAPVPAGTDTAAAGGLFVEQGAPAQGLVDALDAQTAPDGAPLFADAFASYAVQFGSYC
jgi:hypothetical protein